MRTSFLTAPALTLAIVAVATGCSASGGDSTARSAAGPRNAGVSVQQSSSASGGGASAVSQSRVGRDRAQQTASSGSGAAGREHHPADFGDLGRLAVRCEPGGRLAIGVELPPGAAAVDAQLSIGAARVQRHLTGGQHAWSPPLPANDAFARLRRGHDEATAAVGVAHASGGCVVTGVQSSHRRTG